MLIFLSVIIVSSLQTKLLVNATTMHNCLTLWIKNEAAYVL